MVYSSPDICQVGIGVGAQQQWPVWMAGENPKLLKKFLLKYSLFYLSFTLVPEVSDTAHSYTFCGFYDVNYVLDFSIATLGFVFLRSAKSVPTDPPAFYLPNLCCSCHISVLPVFVAYCLLNQSITFNIVLVGFQKETKWYLCEIYHLNWQILTLYHLL